MSTHEEIQLLKSKQNVRHLAILAHVDHGATTTSELLCSNKIPFSDASSNIGVGRRISLIKHRRKYQISAYGYNDYGYDECLINIFHPPGLSDFNNHHDRVLKGVDGAIIVIDCIEGIAIQTEMAIRSCIMNRVKPILFINKFDRPFIELAGIDLDEIYQTLRNAVDSFNYICQTYKDYILGNIDAEPWNNNVIFGSARYQWGFTMNTFAAMYSGQFGLSTVKMCKKLWPHYSYWHSNARSWVKKKTDDSCKRGFVEFVMKPIQALHDAVLNHGETVYAPIIESLMQMNMIQGDEYDKWLDFLVMIYTKSVQRCLGKDVIIPNDILYLCRVYYKQLDNERPKPIFNFDDIKDMRPRDMLNAVLREWLPLDKALMDCIVEHLPSPDTAQKYRIHSVYTGNLNETVAKDMNECKKEAELSVMIMDMIPTKDKGRFMAVGRIFSGVLHKDQEVFIMGVDYKHGQKQDLYRKQVGKLYLINDGDTMEVDQASAGDVIGIMGIDQSLVKTGTLTSSLDIHPFRVFQQKSTRFSVFKMAIGVKETWDLPKLIKGLERLKKNIDVHCVVTQQGQYVIEFNKNVGQLQAEIIIKDWQQYDPNIRDVTITVSDPMVSYKETVTSITGTNDEYPRQCMARSPNKHNRIYMNAQPLSQDFITALENNEIRLPAQSEMETFGKQLEDKYDDWNVNEAVKIWTFGIANTESMANCIVDTTRGVQYLREIKDSVLGGFNKTISGGVLCDEPLYGVRFNVLDVHLHADAIHRGAGQIMPLAKRAMYACQIASEPRLMEPIYSIKIDVPKSAQHGVYQALEQVGGELENVQDRIATELTAITVSVPVRSSYRFNSLLRKYTSGRAFGKEEFAGWRLIDGDPMQEGTDGYKVLMDVRKRKGLKLAVPKFEDFNHSL